MKKTVSMVPSCLLAFFVSTASAQQVQQPASKGKQLLEYFDSNEDSSLDPYEVLDCLLVLQDDLGQGTLTVDALVKAMERQDERRGEESLDTLIKGVDANQDGKATIDEFLASERFVSAVGLDKSELSTLVEVADKDRDGIISIVELDRLLENIDEGSAKGEADGAEGYFAQLDLNDDGFIAKEELEDGDWAELAEIDENKDGKVSLAEFVAELEEAPVQFAVKDGVAFMTGVIGSGTPATVLRLINEHPQVYAIEMVDCPGSMDDEANVRAARYVRQHGFATILRSNSEVASGGTDFFLAGKTRIVEKGAKVGIHSWAGDDNGSDLPKTDPRHQLYLKFYEEMGIPAAFYWRTLEAAPADSIHWMTSEELGRYGFSTEASTSTRAVSERQAADALREEGAKEGHIFKTSSEQIKTLNSRKSIGANTKWNLEKMRKHCDSIAENEQGYHEATFSDGHVLIFVPQGSFQMGTDALKDLDKPVHRVGLRGYWIAKYLVTNAQFNLFVEDTKFKTDAEQPRAEGPYVYSFEERYFKPTQGRTWRNAFKECVDRHPVVAVSWHDSQAFSTWLGKKLDLELHLPTEAQWEKAARGTDERMYPWGNSAPDGSQCNFCDAQFAKDYNRSKQGNPDMKADDGYSGLSPVDAFPEGASPYGVFDMGGNVSNWVADWLGEYPDFDLIDPKGLSRGSERCMRGGFWVADAGQTKASIREQHNCRSECRSADDPHSSDDHLGFRFAVQFQPDAKDGEVKEQANHSYLHQPQPRRMLPDELRFVRSKVGVMVQNASGYYEATFKHGPTFVHIPAGSFTMGNDENKGALPEHRVNLSQYWISKTPVTIGQFRAFVDETGYKSEVLKGGHEGSWVYDFASSGFQPKPGYYWDNAFKDVTAKFPNVKVDDRHPVSSVSWNDAIAYTAWLSKKLSVPVSLPTEAEWEYAARGNDGRIYPWGNEEPDGTRANYADATFDKYFPKTEQALVHHGVNDGFAITSPVGSYPNGKSPFGVLDMAGNITEWVFDSKYELDSTNISEVSDPVHILDNGENMEKGGLWCGSAGRVGQTPDEIKMGHNIRTDTRPFDEAISADDHMGFRIAISYTSRTSRNMENGVVTPK